MKRLFWQGLQTAGTFIANATGYGQSSQSSSYSEAAVSNLPQRQLSFLATPQSNQSQPLLPRTESMGHLLGSLNQQIADYQAIPGKSPDLKTALGFFLNNFWQYPVNEVRSNLLDRLLDCLNDDQYAMLQDSDLEALKNTIQNVLQKWISFSGNIENIKSSIGNVLANPSGLSQSTLQELVKIHDQIWQIPLAYFTNNLAYITSVIPQNYHDNGTQLPAIVITVTMSTQWAWVGNKVRLNAESDVQWNMA